MKKLFLFLLAGSLFWACSDDKKDDGPTPPPEVGSPERLVDGNLETIFSKDGAEVSVTFSGNPVPSSLKAYSLYSSGEAVDYDPASWKVYGSNDEQSWTLIEERTDESFFARYQEHLYVLSANVNYKYVKLDMKPKGGKTLKLAEVVFHATNPDAGWENYTPPAIIFRNDDPDSRGSQYYNELVQDKTRYLQYHAKQVAKQLYFNEDDDIQDVRYITYVINNYDGVSYKSGSVPHITIVYSTKHIETSYNTSMFKLDFETKGVLFHEMTHAYQFEPRGIPGYQEPNTSWQIIEGLADGVRANANYFPWTNRTAGGSYTNGYQKTGFFLQWLTTKDPDALRKINASCRDLEEWSWDRSMRYVFGEDAPGTAELWSEYQREVF